MAGSYDLYIEQGSTFSKTFTWYNSSKVAIDLTDYTAVMQIRQSVGDDTTIIASNVDPPDIVLTLGGALGNIKIDISSGITSALCFDTAVWDINLIHTPTGVVTRLLEGDVKFSLAVTKVGAEINPAIQNLIGINEGDIIRWDATLSRWEVVAEPFEFDEIRLIPKTSSTGAEGTVFYSSVEKSLIVAVEV
jgi:hypothetical protein